MTTRSLTVLLKEHPFAHGLTPRSIETLAGCARHRTFRSGEYLWRQGEPADVFYLIRSGQVALEILIPSQGPLQVETIRPGEILGWSWLLPPYRWPLDARATTLIRALAIDSRCLQAKCEQDPAFGYQLLKQFVPLIAHRLQSTRLRLLDLLRAESVVPGVSHSSGWMNPPRQAPRLGLFCL